MGTNTNEISVKINFDLTSDGQKNAILSGNSGQKNQNLSIYIDKNQYDKYKKFILVSDSGQSEINFLYSDNYPACFYAVSSRDRYFLTLSSDGLDVNFNYFEGFDCYPDKNLILSTLETALNRDKILAELKNQVLKNKIEKQEKEKQEKEKKDLAAEKKNFEFMLNFDKLGQKEILYFDLPEKYHESANKIQRISKNILDIVNKKAQEKNSLTEKEYLEKIFTILKNHRYGKSVLEFLKEKTA
jgi:hypothetical protein